MLLACRNIVQEHVTKFSQLELDLDEGMDCLPMMYWIHKIRKNPVGNRFIVASPKCSLKPLLKDVTSILKLFQHQIKSLMIRTEYGRVYQIFGLYKIMLLWSR